MPYMNSKYAEQVGRQVLKNNKMSYDTWRVVTQQVPGGDWIYSLVNGPLHVSEAIIQGKLSFFAIVSDPTSPAFAVGSPGAWGLTEQQIKYWPEPLIAAQKELERVAEWLDANIEHFVKVKSEVTRSWGFVKADQALASG